MNVLFICQANVGRSQAAMELYREKGGKASSAGTKVDEPGTTLDQRPGAVNIVKVMHEDYDIDMNSNVRTQLTEHFALNYDKLIVMAEPETWPEWLRHDKRVAYWEVQDPKRQDISTTRKIVHEINKKIEELI